MAWSRLVLRALLMPAGALSRRMVIPNGKAAALAGGAYGLYSWMVLRRLAPRYAAMRCLAAVAAPTPNATEIAELAGALPARGPPAPAPADQIWEQLWPAGAPDGPLEAKRSGWRDTGDDAVAVRREGAAWKVFARQGDDAARPAGSVLAELADAAPLIVERPFARVRWSRALRRLDDGTAAAAARGRYLFVFRDYVNAEELSAMAAARGAATALLFCLVGKTALEVAPDGRVTLRDRFRLLGFLPLTVRWSGEQAGGEIRWTATEARLGWRWFGRTFDNPGPSERLSREPWDCRPVGDELLVLRRRGVGALVFKAVVC